MRVYLLMYRPHQRAGFEVLMAYIDKHKAEAALDRLMLGHERSASSGDDPFYVTEIVTID